MFGANEMEMKLDARRQLAARAGKCGPIVAKRTLRSRFGAKSAIRLRAAQISLSSSA
jgi:hypothetical protein